MPLWKIHRRPKQHIDPRGDLHPAGETVLASAALVSKDQVRSVVGRKADWQADAWGLYDTVSELRFGVSWISNACSRARLYVGVIDPDGSSAPIPVDHDDSDETAMVLSPLEELGGGQLGQSEMLRRLSIHLNIPGESYLVGFDDDKNERVWMVASPDEISTTGATVSIRSPMTPDHYIKIDPAKSTILRIWRPHPRYAYYPDSPLMALRQPLRELVDLSAHITATAESRLAGAGVLFVPDELTIPTPAQSDGVNPLHSDPFTSALIEAMAAPLRNRDSASAIVPLVVRGPSQHGKELRHITFATDFDARANELRESAIRRVATGMDMPPEVLTGLGSTNHWCVPDTTQIMTPDGWTPYTALQPGDTVLTWNIEDQTPQWQPATAVQSWPVTDEPMLTITGPGHHSVTTLAHRWPVIRDGDEHFVTSKDLRSSDMIRQGDGTLLPLSRCTLDYSMSYTGTIWCPTTGNSTWMARHNDTVFYTGNSAWQIEESAIKLHIEPLLGLICDSLTTHFFQPALKSLGVEAWPKYAIWYDTTDLTLRPNRAPEAENAYNKGVISEDAYRRELGFADEDAPDTAERRRYVLTQIALTQPQLSPFALRALGIDLPGVTGTPGQTDTITVSRAPAQPRSQTDTGIIEADAADDTTQRTSPPGSPRLPSAGTEGTGNTPPGRQSPALRPGIANAAHAWRTRCLDMAVIRALDRAGQYLIRSTPRSQRVQLQRMLPHCVHLTIPAGADKLDDMLKDAYKEFHAATPGESCLHQAVDHYVRALLLAREQHRADYLDRAIAQFGCDTDSPVIT
jgi:hypothetical protein